MSDRDTPDDHDNPAGLGPRDRESSNTGSVEDTSYDAVGSDPYTTGEPRKRFDRDTGASSSADADAPRSDER